MTVAFFDLDRTVLDCNSGRLWLAHEWRSGRVGVRDAAWASWWLLRYSVGLGDGLEQVFAAAVASYAGQDDAALAARTAAWFQAQVAHRARPGALAALEAHREAGDLVVLATSSTHYVADVAAARWGFDASLCTRLEVEDGRVTGSIETLGYGDAKLPLCRGFAEARGVPLERCAFYTDSITDAVLLEAVGRPVVVNPDRALRRLASARGWPVEDWGRSDPPPAS